MRLTIIESPFWSPSELKRYTFYTYAMRAVRHSLLCKEAPLASHLIYTLVLNDMKEEERTQGIAAGHAWITMADLMVVYWDYGISKGMKEGIKEANACGLSVEFRKIGKNTQTIYPSKEYWVTDETTQVSRHALFSFSGAPCYVSEM